MGGGGEWEMQDTSWDVGDAGCIVMGEGDAGASLVIGV